MKKLIALLLLASQLAQAAGETRIKGGIITPGALSVGSPSAANSKAALEVSSTTKGALLPRMTTAQRDAIASPPTGLELYNTTTNQKNVYNGTAWVAVGAGGSGGGVNFVSQSTAWEVTSTDDRDLNLTIGNWLAFADAAAGTPVDLTGGSPSVTCTRNATDPLDGAASLDVTTTAANRQGEGCSVVFNVQPAYQGSTATITASLKIRSGTLVQGDWKFFVYNVTKSQLITPFNNDIVVGPTLTATFPLTGVDSTPVNHQYRLGIYRASSNATASVLELDDISVSPGQAAYGMAGSNWADYTPTISGCTSPVISYAQWRRVGQNDEIRSTFTCTTAGVSTLKVSLPTNHIANQPFDTVLNGTFITSYNGGTQAGMVPLLLSADTSNIQIGKNNSASGFTAVAANAVAINGSVMSITATVPIVGYDTNLSIGNSSTFNISSYLANGSRVTGSAPTALGQYRSYLRNANATTFTETNGAPTATPSGADGIKVYAGNAYNAADTNGEPTKYDIFVGKKKNVTWQFYKSSARTGQITVDQYTNNGGSYDVGYITAYDPTTGIATIVGFRDNTGTTSHYSGIDDSLQVVTDCYFDLVVSENALGVASSSPRSYIVAQGANGYGSSGTKIRKWTTVTTTGGAITYTGDATNGDKFTANEDGLYNISYCDQFSSGNDFGISLNSSQLSTSVFSATAADILIAADTSAANFANCVSVTPYLPAGSVVRAHTNGTASGVNTTAEKFRITKVAN